MTKHRWLSESDLGLSIAGLAEGRRPRTRGLYEDRTGDRTVCKVAIFCDGKLCMGIRNDNGKWTIPGGHADEGETKEQAAVREVQEETGIVLDESDLEYLGTRDVEKDDGTITVHAFRAEVPSDATDTAHDPDAEVTDWEWIDVSDGLPDYMDGKMHVEPKYDVVMQSLGLAPQTEEVVPAGDRELDDEQTLELFGVVIPGEDPGLKIALESIREDLDDGAEDEDDEEVGDDEVEDDEPAACKPKAFGRISKRLYRSIDDLRHAADESGIADVVAAADGMEDSYWEIQKAIARASSNRREESVEGMIDGMLEEMRK